MQHPALDRLALPATLPSEAWNVRCERHMRIARGFVPEGDAARTTSVEELAALVREQHELSVGKALSFGERSLARTAKALLATEIASSVGRSESEVLAEIDRILARAVEPR